MTDPYVGQLTFLRVYSGRAELVTRSTTRPARGTDRPHPADARQPRDEIKEVARRRHRRRVGMKDATTGDTLCDPHKIITWSACSFPSR